MMIVKRKCFGFIDRMRGNPELRKKMLSCFSSGRIDPKVPKELPEDLRRYMTFLIDNGCENSKEMMSTGNNSNVNFSLFSYNQLIRQLYENKTPFGVRSTNEKRIVLMQSINFTISYSIDNNQYELREETNSTDLVGRAVNRLFNTSNKPVLTSKSLAALIVNSFLSLV